MNRALALAGQYGVGVRFADLGDWSPAELRAEYDPHGPEIRINLRLAQRLAPDDLGRFVTLAIGHELYHHRELLGEIAAIADRAHRERAADEYAAGLADEPR